MNIYITTETNNYNSTTFYQKLFFSLEEAFCYTVKKFIEASSDLGFRVEFHDNKFYINDKEYDDFINGYEEDLYITFNAEIKEFYAAVFGECEYNFYISEFNIPTINSIESSIQFLNELIDQATHDYKNFINKEKISIYEELQIRNYLLRSCKKEYLGKFYSEEL